MHLTIQDILTLKIIYFTKITLYINTYPTVFLIIAYNSFLEETRHNSDHFAAIKNPTKIHSKNLCQLILSLVRYDLLVRLNSLFIYLYLLDSLLLCISFTLYLLG